MISRRTLAVLSAAVLAGCSSAPRSYSSSLPSNMQVTTRAEGAKAAFDIHRLKADCELDFQGRINLENGTVGVGVPTDEPLYLDFIFVTGGGFFSSSVGSTRYGTLFRARPGFDYRAQATYDKGIYSVEIRESRKGASASRVLDRVPLGACKPKAG